MERLFPFFSAPIHGSHYGEKHPDYTQLFKKWFYAQLVTGSLGIVSIIGNIFVYPLTYFSILLMACLLITGVIGLKLSSITSIYRENWENKAPVPN